MLDLLNVENQGWARDGTGRDSPANFCPGLAFPAGQSCGTVPRKFVPVPLVPQTSVPVPVPRDTKSAGTDRDSRPAGQFRESRQFDFLKTLNYYFVKLGK